MPGAGGDCLFYPGVPRLKLWRDTLDHFGLNERTLVRDRTRTDKYHLPLVTAFHPHPLPLRRLYALERSAAGGTPTITAVARHAAIGLLIEHTYRPGLMRQVGDAREHLRQCGQVAGTIQTFRYTRPWGLERLDGDLDRLLRHLNGDGD